MQAILKIAFAISESFLLILTFFSLAISSYVLIKMYFRTLIFPLRWFMVVFHCIAYQTNEIHAKVPFFVLDNCHLSDFVAYFFLVETKINKEAYV